MTNHEEEVVINEEMALKLEEAYLNGKVKPIQFSRNHKGFIDDTIELLASLPSQNFTIHELVEYAEDNLYIRFESSDISAIDAFYPYYVDLEAVKARPDNLLNMPTNISWVTRFHIAVAQMLLPVHGKPVKILDKTYGWEDDSAPMPEPRDVIAVFNVQEDEWGDFTGTFSGIEPKKGMSADFVYSNGYSRRLRFEGTIMEIMEKLV